MGRRWSQESSVWGVHWTPDWMTRFYMVGKEVSEGSMALRTQRSKVCWSVWVGSSKVKRNWVNILSDLSAPFLNSRWSFLISLQLPLLSLYPLWDQSEPPWPSFKHQEDIHALTIPSPPSLASSCLCNSLPVRASLLTPNFYLLVLTLPLQLQRVC